MLKEGKNVSIYDQSEMRTINQSGGRRRSRRLSFTPSEMEIVVKHKNNAPRTRRLSFSPSEMEIVVKPSGDHHSRVNEAFDERPETIVEENENGYNLHRQKRF